MTIEEFRKKHGREWGKIVHISAFEDALKTVEQEANFFQVIDIDNAEIKAHGDLILSQQKGFKIFATALRSLHVEPAGEMEDLGQEQYPDPLEEIADGEKKRKPAKEK